MNALFQNAFLYGAVLSVVLVVIMATSVVVPRCEGPTTHLKLWRNSD